MTSERIRLPQNNGETGVHRTGDDQHDRVVNDFHDGDRRRVGREREPERRPSRYAGAEQWQTKASTTASATIGPLLQPSAVPITIPSTSPIEQPVKQCTVALNARRFSED